MASIFLTLTFFLSRFVVIVLLAVAADRPTRMRSQLLVAVSLRMKMARGRGKGLSMVWAEIDRLHRVDEYLCEYLCCANKPLKLTNRLATGFPEDCSGLSGKRRGNNPQAIPAESKYLAFKSHRLKK